MFTDSLEELDAIASVTMDCIVNGKVHEDLRLVRYWCEASGDQWCYNSTRSRLVELVGTEKEDYRASLIIDRCTVHLSDGKQVPLRSVLPAVAIKRDAFSPIKVVWTVLRKLDGAAYVTYSNDAVA